MTKAKEYNLRIGDSALIKRGFITKVSLVYAGMPNDRVYSLVVTCRQATTQWLTTSIFQ